ncbi:hypothetical protein HMPREF1167_03555 [Aeromonas veronii AER39]|nr:hypothetical protein HMPREF1167_03555 [Aeromonas veronii AER39]
MTADKPLNAALAFSGRVLTRDVLVKNQYEKAEAGRISN